MGGHPMTIWCHMGSPRPEGVQIGPPLDLRGSKWGPPKVPLMVWRGPILGTWSYRPYSVIWGPKRGLQMGGHPMSHMVYHMGDPYMRGSNQRAQGCHAGTPCGHPFKGPIGVIWALREVSIWTPYHMGSHPIWGPYPYLEGVPRSGGGPQIWRGSPKWEVLRSEDLQIHGFDLIFRGLDLF